MLAGCVRHLRPGRAGPGASAAVMSLVLVALISLTGTPAAAAPPPSSARPAAAEAPVWAQAPESTAGTPVVTSAADGATVVLARGADDTVYRRTHNREDDSWSAWTSTGGTALGDPVTARELSGRPSVFVRRADGRLWAQRQTADGGWSAWRDLGAPDGTAIAGAPVVVANDNRHSSPLPDTAGFVRGNTDGRLELFARGADNRIWHRVQKDPNGAEWSRWESLPGTWAGSPAAVVAGDGRISVVARKPDGRLRVTAQKVPGTPRTPLPEDNWSEWKQIGTEHTGNPAVAVNTVRAGTLLQVFANRSDGRLWTVTQTAPGTGQDPAGVWSTAERIGPAAPGRPVVTTHSDGRLAVFGVNAEDRVAYRTQTSPATGNDPNGVWAAGWRSLDGQKVQSVTAHSVRRGHSTSFGVFALGKESDTIHQRSRLSLGDPRGSREDVWLDWADLGPVGSGPCAGPSSLECLTIESDDLGLVLSLENSLKPDSAIVREQRRSVPWQTWAMRPTNDPRGAVSIVNRLKGRCIDRTDPLFGPVEFELAPCDPASVDQQWYIEPVLPPGADKATRNASAFRLRHRGDASSCLTALSDALWPETLTRVVRRKCDSNAAKEHDTWRLGHSTLALTGRVTTTAPGVLATVLKQSAARCELDPGDYPCVFIPTTEEPAHRAAERCVVGKVLYNQGSAQEGFNVSWFRPSGTDFSFGGAMAHTDEFLPATFNFTADLSDWLQEGSVGDQAHVSVPPKQFGWVETAPVARETTGYWRVTLGRLSWTVPARNVSYAKNGTDGVEGSTVIRVSKTPPHYGHCEN